MESKPGPYTQNLGNIVNNIKYANIYIQIWLNSKKCSMNYKYFS